MDSPSTDWSTTSESYRFTMFVDCEVKSLIKVFCRWSSVYITMMTGMTNLDLWRQHASFLQIRLHRGCGNFQSIRTSVVRRARSTTAVNAKYGSAQITN